MSELKKLVAAAIILITLGVITLMGIAMIGDNGFARVLRTPTESALTDQVLATNGTGTDFGTSWPFVQDVTSCINASGGANLGVANYSIQEGTVAGGGITLNDNGADWSSWSVNCTVDYLASNSRVVTAGKFVTGLGFFGLFVGVLAIAVIGIAIIKFFRND